MKRMLLNLPLLILLFPNLSAANTTLTYYLTLQNSDKEVVCDLFSIQDDRGMCREGSGMYSYQLDSIEQVRVFNGNKAYTFTQKEIRDQRDELTAAFDTLNGKKMADLREAYRQKQEYLAKKRMERAEALNSMQIAGDSSSYLEQEAPKPAILPPPIGEIAWENSQNGVGWIQAIAINQDRAKAYISELRYKNKVVRPRFYKPKGWQSEKAMHEVLSAIYSAEDMRAAGRHDLISIPVYKQGPEFHKK